MTTDLLAYHEKRTLFFNRVIDLLDHDDSARAIVLTHILADRPSFLQALDQLVSIDLLIPVPYSVHDPTLQSLQGEWPLHCLSLEQLRDPQALREALDFMRCNPGDRCLILEVGGYFARIAHAIQPILSAFDFRGVVEDTEAGHRRYKNADDKDFAVISIARSPLKLAEDQAIGDSILYSIESVVRQNLNTLIGMPIGVMGYGKIGQSVASAAARRRARVYVYDKSPAKMVAAESDGFYSLSREELLTSCSIIIGCTGEQCLAPEDLPKLTDGVLLASATSRQVEFPVEEIRALSTAEASILLGDRLQPFSVENTTMYLMDDGLPVNFPDGAVLGPILDLVQGELLVAVHELLSHDRSPGVYGVPDHSRQALAAIWTDFYGRHGVNPHNALS